MLPLIRHATPCRYIHTYDADVVTSGHMTILRLHDSAMPLIDARLRLFRHDADAAALILP